MGRGKGRVWLAGVCAGVLLFCHAATDIWADPPQFVVSLETVDPSPAPRDVEVALTVEATYGETDVTAATEFRANWGDGSPWTEWSQASIPTKHEYTAVGTYMITVGGRYKPPGQQEYLYEGDRQTVHVWDVKITAPDAWQTWIPENGNTLSFTGAIEHPDVQGKIKFSIESSNVTGWCVNRGTSTDNDLKFQNPQAGFTITGDQDQYAETTAQVNSAEVNVKSFDCGSYGSIKVEATVAGRTKTGHVAGGEEESLSIPKDDDANNIADSWQYNQGAATDDADTSKNNTHNGDGLTRYAEYRGVDIDNDGTVSGDERLNPSEKDLFVQGQGFGGGFPDFAVGNAFQEADINVHIFKGQVGTDDNNIDVLLVTLEDSGGHIERKGPPYPTGERSWEFSTLGQSQFGGAGWYGQPTQVFKKAVNYYFSEKPYHDGNTWTGAGQWGGAPNGVLDPVNPERVEDTNDNGELDANEKDGPATSPHDDADNDFDGDYPVKAGNTWDWNQELSPQDIDNDGQVELPRKSQCPVTSDEYTKEDVVRHVITHEMGHAAGVNWPGGGHCTNNTCLMYQWSNNWSRDGHFCDDCRGKLYVHNN